MSSNLLERPFFDVEGPLYIAHRGGDAAGKEKENSLVAFQSAVDSGFSYCETDTVATKDGVALAIHGSMNFLQEHSSGLPIRSRLEMMTYDEVRKLRIGGEPVPTLEEVLVTFPSMKFFIDPKREHSVEPLAELINKLLVHDRVSVGAFNYARTKKVVSLLNKNDISCSIGFSGFLSLVGGNMSLSMARKYIKQTCADNFAVPYKFVTNNMVDRAHELGMRVFLWTPNTQEDIQRAYNTGADGVISDRTLLVKQVATKLL